MPQDDITELKIRVPGGKYALARAVAERARQLQSGAMPLTEVRTPNPLSVAIDEIMQGKVTFVMEAPIDEAISPGKNYKKPVEGVAPGEVAAPNTVDETLARNVEVPDSV